MAHSVSETGIVAQAVKGSHLLTIDGYSRIVGLGGNDRLVTSDPFDVGGYRWYIKYYPDGDSPINTGWISVYLCLYYLCENPDRGVDASCQFSLINGAGEPSPGADDTVHTFKYANSAWGYPKFIHRKYLEQSDYLSDDCCTIRCDVTVWTQVRTGTGTGSIPRERDVTVPPSDLHQHLGVLLESQVGTDVMFQVGDETFAAHRPVLAARSPVFMAQLFGQMKETTTTSHIIRIDDMEPRVFRALLHFVYTDSLPEMNSVGGGRDAAAMVQHLLVAADKYGMERLQLVCEDRLCNYMNTGTAASMLEFAEQYGFIDLKLACFKFLKAPGNLKAIMSSNDFERLITRSPSLINELLANVAP